MTSCSIRSKRIPITFPISHSSWSSSWGQASTCWSNRMRQSPGHFGLAVQDYTHSTAPNRRFPDVVTQRLLKAQLTHTAPPYSEDALNAIAQRCTEMEDAARKVEREMQKRIAAVVLHPHIGQSYQAIVTGVNNYGTFVRTLDPHVEGMLVQWRQGPRRGRQSHGEAGLHRSRARIHRFRSIKRSYSWICENNRPIHVFSCSSVCPGCLEWDVSAPGRHANASNKRNCR